MERVYTVPLRKEFMKVPRYQRSKKAIKALKEFLLRHMKVEEIKLSQALNAFIWKDGIKNPPHHVKVMVKRLDDHTAKAMLFGEKEEQPEQEQAKKEVKTEKQEQLEEKAETKEKPVTKDEEQAEAKETEKEEKKKEEKEEAQETPSNEEKPEKNDNQESEPSTEQKKEKV